MGRLRDSELRLSDVIEETELALSDARDHKQDLLAQAVNLKAELNNLAQALHNRGVELDKQIREGRAAVREAKQSASIIEGHNMWKAAVRAMHGEEGLRACIEWMEANK